MVSSVDRIKPSLDSTLVKGDAGRILVVGGSLEYTGAPYFVAMSAMRTGVDLAHIICHEAAGTAIKSYSPDLIVHPLINSSTKDAQLQARIIGILDRVDAVVVGPGLSRDPLMGLFAHEICRLTVDKQLPLLIDGDGIDLLIQHYDYWKDLGRKRNLVLTPNHREFARLCAHHEINPLDREAPKKLSKLLGNAVVLLKGKSDVVSNGIRIEDASHGLEGCPKRSGGQGDILAGSIAAYLAWNNKAKEKVDAMDCCIAGARRIRFAAAKCYSDKKRSMLASDILDYLNF